VALARKSDGSCIYLGAEGCKIYEGRPALCRAFDCRAYVLSIWSKLDPFPSDEVLWTAAWARNCSK
jgi:hypothetical protein